MHKLLALAAAATCALTFPASAAFVADDFNGASLGAQWTWNAGTYSDTSVATSTYAMTGNAFRLTAAPGTDQSANADRYAYIEQDAPAGTDWEVITRIDDFNSSQAGYQLGWQKTGMMLWQDNEHWVMVSIAGDSVSGAATNRGIQGSVQYDPGTSTSSAARYRTDSTEYDITTPTIFLKIHKSPKGYVGSASSDGVNWFSLTAVVRNPETSTTGGMFTTEKIRLFQSGGPTTSTIYTPKAADYDFISVQPVTPATAGYQDDEFDGATLAPVWMYTAGSFAGSMAIADGKLKLTTNRYNEIWYDTDRASFVMQDAPTDTQYSLVVKAGPTDQRANPDWTGYGIRVWQDPNHWILVSTQRGSSAYGNRNIVQAAYQHTNGAVQNAGYADTFGTGAGPGYLCIQRNGSSFRPFYSMDGVNWVAVAIGTYTDGWIPFPGGLNNAQVQLFAKRPNGTISDYNTVEFDYIHKMLSAGAADWQLLE